MLDWSQGDLAREAKVGRQTIVDFERGARQPYGRTLADIQRALEAAGIEFVENGAILTATSTTTAAAAVQRSSAQIADEARQQARAEFTDKLQDAIHDKNHVQPKPKHRE